jgi:hypothetical protein
MQKFSIENRYIPSKKTLRHDQKQDRKNNLKAKKPHITLNLIEKHI